MASDVSVRINSETDFFTAYSTVDGFVSFRHAREGTYFAQTLMDVWENHFDTVPLEELMKKVR